MTGKYRINDTAFLIESNRFIREVKILKFAGGLYTIQFKDEGGGMKVRESRLFATSDEAQAAIPKPIAPPAPSYPSPWDQTRDTHI